MVRRFRYYLDESLVKKRVPNKEEARSLMAKAIKRLEYLKAQRIDELTAPFVFENTYEAMREAAQALMSSRGYKPYSHEALISFLREFYTFSEHRISAFDRYRILRNKSVYGAARISVSTCRQALSFLKQFLPELRDEFDRETKTRT